MPRMVSTARTARRAGQSFRGVRTPTSGAADPPPAHQPAVAVVERVEDGTERPAEREGDGGEPRLHLRVDLLPGALEREQVGAAPIHDPPGDPRLAGERVQAHQAAAEVDAVEQVGEDAQL